MHKQEKDLVGSEQVGCSVVPQIKVGAVVRGAIDARAKVGYELKMGSGNG